MDGKIAYDSKEYWAAWNEEWQNLTPLEQMKRFVGIANKLKSRYESIYMPEKTNKEEYNENS